MTDRIELDAASLRRLEDALDGEPHVIPELADLVAELRKSQPMPFRWTMSSEEFADVEPDDFADVLGQLLAANQAFIEECWPVVIDNYEPPQQAYARREVFLDRVKACGGGYPFFTWLDMVCLHPASELYAESWREIADRRFIRIGVELRGEWAYVLNFPGAIQTPPPPPKPRPKGKERMLPVYEAKMMHHYNTRWASYGDDGKCRRMDGAGDE